ncbi:MAG: type II toxin-antitoxin system VapC family toxin [Deltaproteobacteria bacterium]|nr:type II toxin-antitoxin system VapC family toxin [Deltaproteobacteria bacterium]
MISIIDASVAIKWFVEDEINKNKSLKILDEIKSSPTDFAVPELFFNEMLAVFCRLVDEAKKIQTYLEVLENLGWARLDNGHETLKKAAELAKKYKITGYDAIYVANAYLVKGRWITADQEAHKKIASLSISKILG